MNEHQKKQFFLRRPPKDNMTPHELALWRAYVERCESWWGWVTSEEKREKRRKRAGY